MKNYCRITVTVVSAILFLTTAVAHACIGTVTARGAHDHSGVQAAGLVQTSHGEAQDENCRSLRDRFLSLVTGVSHTSSLIGDIHATPVAGEGIATAIQMFTAERPPGIHLIADNQSPLYIFHSVFRI